MGKSKEKKKESQLVIRVEKAEKTAFLALCEALDTTAGREVRRFMRAFVAAKSAIAEAESDPAVPSKRAKKTAVIATVPGDSAAPDEAEETSAEPESTPEAPKSAKRSRKRAADRG
ncbi:hypothetical protein ACTTAI_09130 [Rhodobacter capsulatus]|uniref:hypothetical protein n=1 Tax=Rhodobacter capsulatus TaxID=1061 RepID=UPI004027F86C